MAFTVTRKSVSIAAAALLLSGGLGLSVAHAQTKGSNNQNPLTSQSPAPGVSPADNTNMNSPGTMSSPSGKMTTRRTHAVASSGVTVRHPATTSPSYPSTTAAGSSPGMKTGGGAGTGSGNGGGSAGK